MKIRLLLVMLVVLGLSTRDVSAQSMLGVQGTGTGTGTGGTIGLRSPGDEHWTMHEGWKDVRYPATLTIGVSIFGSSTFGRSGWQNHVPRADPAESLDGSLKAKLEVMRAQALQAAEALLAQRHVSDAKISVAQVQPFAWRHSGGGGGTGTGSGTSSTGAGHPSTYLAGDGRFMITLHGVPSREAAEASRALVARFVNVDRGPHGSLGFTWTAFPAVGGLSVPR